MRLYRLADGLAREEDGELLLLDLPHADVGALLADDVELARSARVLRSIPEDEATFLSPVAHPAGLFLHGLVYPGHVAEAGLSVPSSPVFLEAPGGPLDAPGAPVLLPPDAPERVDYEGEIALVVGRDASSVAPDEAWSCVGGLTIVNDVSERAGQEAAMAGGEWDVEAMVRAKRHPGFKPCGPVVVTADEFGPDPALEITTRLNGRVVQRDGSGNMIFSFSQILAAVSVRAWLRPGDVICTGTPAGVGLATGRYLRAGDSVEVEVERIGTLVNPVIEDERPR